LRRARGCPTVWLFTDERQGDGLWRALERLPRGAGVILRQGKAPDRAALGARVAAVARRRRLVFLVADDPALARALRADGVHHSAPARPGRLPGKLRTAAAHSLPELRAAQRAGAELVFISPVFATRTHPGARTLGRARFGRLAQAARVPVAALGGMTFHRFSALRPLGASAWGAIDGLTPARIATPHTRP